MTAIQCIFSRGLMSVNYGPSTKDGWSQAFMPSLIAKSGFIGDSFQNTPCSGSAESQLLEGDTSMHFAGVMVLNVRCFG